MLKSKATAVFLFTEWDYGGDLLDNIKGSFDYTADLNRIGRGGHDAY